MEAANCLSMPSPITFLEYYREHCREYRPHQLNQVPTTRGYSEDIIIKCGRAKIVKIYFAVGRITVVQYCSWVSISCMFHNNHTSLYQYNIVYSSVIVGDNFGHSVPFVNYGLQRLFEITNQL